MSSDSPSNLRPQTVGKRPEVASAHQAVQVRKGVRSLIQLAVRIIATATIITGTVSLIALLTLRDGIERIAGERLPAVVATAEMSQRAERIVAKAPLLAASVDQFHREAAMADLATQTAAFTRLLSEVEQEIVARERVELFARLGAMDAVLRKLNLAVAHRVEADRAIERTLLQLRGYAQRIRQIERGVIRSIETENSGAPGDPRAIQEWAGATMEVINVLYQTASASKMERLARLREEYRRTVAEMARETEALSPTFRSRAKPLRDETLQLGDGPDNLFDAREAYLQAGATVQAAIEEADEAAKALTASVAGVNGAIEHRAREESGALSTLGSLFAVGAALVAVVPIAVGVMIFRVVDRRVLLRIDSLRAAMRARVEGRSAVFDADGQDEIAEMARATAHFVEEIAHRQEIADRARTAAEKTLAELRDTQAELVEREKLATLGQLVAGVAHEINTPVGVALSAASHQLNEIKRLAGLLANQKVKRSDLERFVSVAEEAETVVVGNLKRAAHLVQSFKQVAADRQTAEIRLVDLADYLDEVAQSLGPMIRQGGHALAVTCPPGLWITTCPGALSQVVTILVDNAIAHAFHGRSGGIMHIHVEEMDDRKVMLRFSDDGVGIPAEHLPHLFEPFFTTRRGQGGFVGLGLHIAYNTVSQVLRGEISASSRLGAGASFALTLPIKIEKQASVPTP